MDSFADRLEQIPAVRLEKLRAAKALVSDPSYPSDEQLRKVAELLAAKLA